MNMSGSIVAKLTEWEGVDSPLAPLNNLQEEAIASVAESLLDRPMPVHIKQVFI